MIQDKTFQFFSRFIIVLIFLNISNRGISQKEHIINKCGFDVYMEAMDSKHPGFKDNFNTAFDHAKKENSSFQRDEIITIPLILHIIHQNDQQNLTPNRINSVIESLNKDFRNQNDNAGDIRSFFTDVVSDPKIKFEVKEIKRINTNAKFIFDFNSTSFPENIKSSALGGSDAEDTEKYLNIWVCNIEGGLGLLGYSYPPICAPNWPPGVTAPNPTLDGVVIHYQAFNINSSFIIQGVNVPIDGRTITHEIGHYLGLRHIWGDGTSAQFGIPDCFVDDGIEDTPNQGYPSQLTCNYNQNTCIDSNNDKPDMIENYMDYSDERCMNAFTNDQVQIMRNILLDCRSSIVETVGTQESKLKTKDITITPNPTTGKFSIDIVSSISDIRKLIIYNNIGIVIDKKELQIGTNLFDLSNQSPGIYFLRFIIDKKQIIKKIILIP